MNKILNWHASPEETQMLLSAFHSSGGIYIGYLTAKTGMPVNVAANAFTELEGLGLLTRDGSVLRLTTKGRGWIMENQKNFAYSGEKKWREIPETFKGNTIDAFKPYAPKRSQLSKRFFGID